MENSQKFIFSTVMCLLTVFSFTSATPTQGTPILNSTLGTNLTGENLTIYNQSSDGATKNVINWYKDGTSITLLNMPFEGGSQDGNISGNYNGTRDYSGYGNNGTVNNATWNSTAGYDGKGAYTFEDNDFILTEVDLNKYWTATAWVKPAEINRRNVIFGWCDDDDSDCYNLDYNYWIVAFNHTNEIFTGFAVRDGDPSKFYFGYTDDTQITTANKWYHIAVVFNGGPTESIFVYVDGQQVSWSVARDDDPGDFVFSTQTGIGGTYSTYVGTINSAFGAVSDFNGTIDDVMIFNHSLSSAQVLALYNNGTNRMNYNETNVDDTWYACITPNNGTADGIESCSNNLTVVNAIPELSTPSLLPPVVYDSDDLNATLNYTDDDNDTGTIVFRWYINNMNVLNQTLSNVANGSTFTANFSNGNFTSYHYVNVSAQANDSTNVSTIVWSSTIQINPPNVPSNPGGSSLQNLELSLETPCPENLLQVIVNSSSSEVSDASTRVILYSPYEGLIEEKLTDEDGMASFSISKPGTYQIVVTKTGYKRATESLDFILCTIVNSTILNTTNQSINSPINTSIILNLTNTTNKTSTFTNNTKISSQYTSNSSKSIPNNTKSINNTELKTIPTKPEKETNTTYNSISMATTTISISKSQGLNTTKAEKKLQEAKEQLKDNNYTKAEQLAKEAIMLAQNAKAQATVPTTAQNTTKSISKSNTTSVPKKSDNMLLGLGLLGLFAVVIVSVAVLAAVYFLFTRKK